MRIGVDATCWANERGYGRFARELMQTLFTESRGVEWVCFGDRLAFERLRPTEPGVRLIEVKTSRSPVLAAAADGYRPVGDMLALTRAVMREKTDVFFSPSVYTWFPMPPGQRAVVTIHDAIAERFPHLTLPSRRARVFWKMKVQLALRQSRLVLTVSDFAARDIARVLGIAHSKIRVAVEAPSNSFRPAATKEIEAVRIRLGLPSGARWFAYVGGFNPHKRVDLAIRAHAAAVAGRTDPAPPWLLLVGKIAGDVFHQEIAELRGLVESSGAAGLVLWTGFLTDEELAAVYSGAIATVLPSECEGFGLPAVEAAACGTPAIATTESPLPELLTGGGIFTPPGDLDSLTRAMIAMIDDPEIRNSMAGRARERASRLTWQSAARSALSALREAAA
ncbi:MAG: glycosyltransferase family 4 protein [Gemmatimonadota bacterium]